MMRSILPARLTSFHIVSVNIATLLRQYENKKHTKNYASRCWYSHRFGNINH